MTPTNRFFPRKWLLEKLYTGIGKPVIRLAMETGEQVAPGNVPPVAGVVFHDDRTLLQVCLNPDVEFADAYMEGRLRVEGSLTSLIEEVLQAMSAAGKRSWHQQLGSKWMHWKQPNTLRGSRRNIHQHYDLPTSFYQLWLDPQLVYTCAYFPSPTATLEEAQRAKMDHVCRKLRLQPGERVVEAGCGWGALALHMARNYGVSVRAFNISHEQILLARERAKAEGLDGQVEFIEDDYRNITGRYDAFVSVGMLEHVGPDHYADLGKVIDTTIGATGRGLLHFIGRNRPQPTGEWFLRHIFPGAYLPTLREAMHVLEPFDFSLLDVENLGRHYEKTLAHWLARYEAALPRVRATFDENFVRAWRYYLTAAMVGFRVGHLQLFQLVFAGVSCPRIPWTRAHRYAEEAAAEPEPQWTTVMS